MRYALSWRTSAAYSHGYVRWLSPDLWRPQRAEQTLHAALGEPGFHVATLTYGHSELDERLAVVAASEPPRTSLGI